MSNYLFKAGVVLVIDCMPGNMTVFQNLALGKITLFMTEA